MNLLKRPQVLLLLLAIILLAITFTRPTLELEQATYRYVFIYDISQSMNVMDVPDNESISRLDFAKQATLEALQGLPCGTEAGIALFTGHRAFLLITPVEVCSNYREFSSILNNINWTMTWEAKSEIAKGLYKSIAMLKLLTKDKESEIINYDTRLVFITDGQESPPINLETPPRFPGKIGEISGLVVGVGGEQLVPIPKFDKEGKQDGYWKAEDVPHLNPYALSKLQQEGIKPPVGTEHLSSLKENYLEGLAKVTGLKYYRLESGKKLSDQMKNKSLSNPKIITTDMRWLFALGALLAFITSLMIVPMRKYFSHLLHLSKQS